MQRLLAYDLLEDLRHGRIHPDSEATAQHLIDLGSYLATFITLTHGAFAADWEDKQYTAKASFRGRERPPKIQPKLIPPR